MTGTASGPVCSGGRHSVNASISVPTQEEALQVDEHLPPMTEMHTPDIDLEKSGDSEIFKFKKAVSGPETLDIEHVPVQNDPRKWSSFRKVGFLTQVSIYIY